MDWYVREKGILTEYRFYIEAIQVHFDCSWSEGSVSFYHGSSHSVKRLFTKRRCPKAFLWRPCQPKEIWSDVIIEYAEEGWEHSDIVVTWQEMWETVEKVEYNFKGEAHIQIICSSSFGTSTTIIKIQKIQYYSTFFSLNVIVEFGNSEDCLRFIQHDFDEFYNRDVVPIENDDADPIINDVCKTVAPFALEYRHAEHAAIDRGLHYDDFHDELPPPATALIPHRAPTPTKNDGRPCFLMLHLDVKAWASLDCYPSYIASAHWSATNDIPSTPSRSHLFRHLNNIHLDISSLVSHNRNNNSSSSSHSSTVNIIPSARGIPPFAGMTPLSAVNGLTVNGGHCVVVLNHIGSVMGDGYFAPIHHSNVGGTNSINYIHQ